MNVQRVTSALARINQAMAKGEQHTGAYEWKLLKRAKAHWTKKLAEFTNPKAKPRPLPSPCQTRIRL